MNVECDKFRACQELHLYASATKKRPRHSTRSAKAMKVSLDDDVLRYN